MRTDMLFLVKYSKSGKSSKNNRKSRGGRFEVDPKRWAPVLFNEQFMIII